MELSNIADGLEVTERQRERGVATVDDTGADLPTRLEPFADDLPCAPAAAAAAVEAYTAGASVEETAESAGLAPATAAKALHLLGVEGVSPVGPDGRSVVRDWLAGELGETEARARAGVDEPAFALAAFVETHEPLAGARETVEGALAPDADAAVRKRDALDGTMSDADDFFGR